MVDRLDGLTMVRCGCDVHAMCCDVLAMYYDVLATCCDEVYDEV